MCAMCEAEVKKPMTDFLPVINKRKKVWQLENALHCSVIGTCLSLTELRQLGKKMKLIMPSYATSYDWHRNFVSVAGSETSAAKYLNKFLDKKYKETIKQTLDLSSEDLNNFWNSSLEKDSLPAAFWAILTHPSLTDSLLDKIYGEVHMLSHLSGASLRVDLEKLRRLEREKKTREKLISQSKENIQKRITDTATLITSLKKKIKNISATEKALFEANKIIEKLQSDSELTTLAHKLSDVESRLQIKNNRVQYLEQSVENWKKSALDSGDQICLSEIKVQELLKENSAMETALGSYLSTELTPCNNQDNNTSHDNLDGSCVLYVGGRDRQCAHFRALIEEKNGKFIHHDGGLSDGNQHLGSLLPKADMVFCPIDCISHNAVNRVKKFCSRTGKPLVIMKRASLAAFTKGLVESELLNYKHVGC